MTRGLCLRDFGHYAACAWVRLTLSCARIRPGLPAPGGYAEPPLTLGQDLAFLQDLPADYTAADVVGHLLGTGRDERTTP